MFWEHVYGAVIYSLCIEPICILPDKLNIWVKGKLMKQKWRLTHLHNATMRLTMRKILTGARRQWNHFVFSFLQSELHSV
jgi:hypothetical protein